jgi:hypothetical protein
MLKSRDTTYNTGKHEVAIQIVLYLTQSGMKNDSVLALFSKRDHYC